MKYPEVVRVVFQTEYAASQSILYCGHGGLWGLRPRSVISEVLFSIKQFNSRTDVAAGRQITTKHHFIAFSLYRNRNRISDIKVETFAVNYDFNLSLQLLHSRYRVLLRAEKMYLLPNFEQSKILFFRWGMYTYL